MKHALPNGLELSCPAEAGRLPLILAHTGGPGTVPHSPARRVSFSELLGGGRHLMCRLTAATLLEAPSDLCPRIDREVGLHPACEPFMDIRDTLCKQGEVPIFGKEALLYHGDSIG